MRWPPVYWIFAALLICGCGGQRVGFDPFGRTTIPPPPTAMRSANADPYYSNAASAAAPSMVALPQGTTVSAPAAFAAAPSGSSPTGGWRAAGAPNAESALTATPPPGRLRPVPTYVDNSPDTSNITLTAGNPDAWTTSDHGTADFQDTVGDGFSTANSSSQPYQVRYGGDASQVYDPLAPQSESLGGGATTPRPAHRILARSGPFGHASDYTWLKGRLEYKVGQRQWKLRYVPVDEQPDAFGDSVVLPAFSELENYRTGDMVVVHGRLAEMRLDVPPDQRTFHVTRLERQ